MQDNRSHALGWLSKATSDLLTAQRVLEGPGPFDTACFHTQQAAEKALKAFLAFHEQPIPRTHNLEELQQLCLAVGPELQLAGIDLTELTPYAVELRYDIDFWPDRETAEEAVKLARDVHNAVLAALPEEARP